MTPEIVAAVNFFFKPKQSNSLPHKLSKIDSIKYIIPIANLTQQKQACNII